MKLQLPNTPSGHGLWKAIAIVAAFVLLVVAGMISQKKQKIPQDIPHVEQQPVKVDLAVKVESSDEHNSEDGRITTFYFKPSPDELWEKILSLEAAHLPLTPDRIIDTEIIWQLYFFKVLYVKETTATVLFDVAEHGFGLEIQAHVDTVQYPQILQLEKGRKVWLAGDILGADSAGTGTINLHAEYVSFTEKPPASVAPVVAAPAKKKGEEPKKHGEEPKKHGEESGKHGQEKKH